MYEVVPLNLMLCRTVLLVLRSFDFLASRQGQVCYFPERKFRPADRVVIDPVQMCKVQRG